MQTFLDPVDIYPECHMTGLVLLMLLSIHTHGRSITTYELEAPYNKIPKVRRTLRVPRILSITYTVVKLCWKVAHCDAP